MDLHWDWMQRWAIIQVLKDSLGHDNVNAADGLFQSNALMAKCGLSVLTVRGLAPTCTWLAPAPTAWLKDASVPMAKSCMKANALTATSVHATPRAGAIQSTLSSRTSATTGEEPILPKMSYLCILQISLEVYVVKVDFTHISHHLTHAWQMPTFHHTNLWNIFKEVVWFLTHCELCSKSLKGWSVLQLSWMVLSSLQHLWWGWHMVLHRLPMLWRVLSLWRPSLSHIWWQDLRISRHMWLRAHRGLMQWQEGYLQSDCWECSLWCWRPGLHQVHQDLCQQEGHPLDQRQWCPDHHYQIFCSHWTWSGCQGHPIWNVHWCHHWHWWVVLSILYVMNGMNTCLCPHFPGLRVRWDKAMRVYIHLDSKYMNSVCGLCGNFDGNAYNDFVARSGLLETGAVQFANTWRTKSSCPEAGVRVDPCDANPARKYWAMSSCEILKTSAFKPCHEAVSTCFDTSISELLQQWHSLLITSQVDVDKYYNDCVFDTCGCNRGGDCECLCTAVSAYVRECNEEGIHIRWRGAGICGEFPYHSRNIF